jgi:hypothetical protein
MNSKQKEEKPVNTTNKVPLFYYSMAPELNTQPAVTLFFDANDKIPLLNKDISIAELRLFIILSTYCEPETNIVSFKYKDRLAILIDFSRQGIEYKDETLKKAKERLVKKGFLASLKVHKRGYLMLNPSMLYYGGRKSTAQLRYGNLADKKGQKLEQVRQSRIKDFLQLKDDQNKFAQNLAAEKLFEIYTINTESQHMTTYSKR